MTFVTKSYYISSFYLFSDYYVIPGTIVGDGDRKRAPFLVLELAPWFKTIFSIFRTNCAIACRTRAYMLRGFSQMSRGKNGVRNSRNRFMLFSFGPQLNAFMAVGILLKYFCRKLLQFEWRQCRIYVCPALYRWPSSVPLLLLQELHITPL